MLTAEQAFSRQQQPGAFRAIAEELFDRLLQDHRRFVLRLAPLEAWILFLDLCLALRNPITGGPIGQFTGCLLHTMSHALSTDLESAKILGALACTERIGVCPLAKRGVRDDPIVLDMGSNDPAVEELLGTLRAYLLGTEASEMGCSPCQNPFSPEIEPRKCTAWDNGYRRRKVVLGRSSKEVDVWP